MDYALVTGSSGGLGYCIAREFARHGVVPILTGRDPESLQRASRSIEDVSGLTPLSFSGDLTEASAPAQLYEYVSDRGAIPRYLAHNLGGGIRGDRKNPPREVLRPSFRLNFEVAVELNALFYDDLTKLSAKILHIGSTSSLHYDAPPGYLVSKAAIIPYVKNAAKSFAEDGLSIFAILPGMLEHPGSYTDRLRARDPQRHARFLEGMPYGRFVPSADVAKYAVSLCLVDSPMINGSIVVIDGGAD
ncbi:SDR family NAD(P)-dependent oxidoreductase [Thiorhodococcus minor]|uniref:SDR family oxidoreductase n=1 Tax=Thiorhodococcus minor TaxID=57489 RepID=A0A6M0JSQ0_9GAMM|nr:SDR family oxidoreductase [Thiorhodococcus minor]NEV60550.1 SDR family oxidoreductase [Thiorhodococcus minor]